MKHRALFFVIILVLIGGITYFFCFRNQKGKDIYGGKTLLLVQPCNAIINMPHEVMNAVPEAITSIDAVTIETVISELDTHIKPDNANPKENNVLQTNHAISDETAIAIAKDIIGDLQYDKTQEIKVERIDKTIRITFPIKPAAGGRGPDYAAQITIDAEKGELIRGRRGR